MHRLSRVAGSFTWTTWSKVNSTADFQYAAEALSTDMTNELPTSDPLNVPPGQTPPGVYCAFLVSMDTPTRTDVRLQALMLLGHICFEKVVCNDYTAAGTCVFVFAPAQHWQHTTFELFSPHRHVNLRSRSHTVGR